MENKVVTYCVYCESDIWNWHKDFSTFYWADEYRTMVEKQGVKAHLRAF